ncbi:MAG: acyl-CoA reductase [Balneolaceae bacterium]
MSIDQRISALIEAIQNWLRPDNQYLQHAIDRTIEEGYFSFEDTKHATLTLKKALSETALREWAERAGLNEEADASGSNLLCLHAGNLPLVGFQDALAVLLSGATYYGKISRKDPYLLPTFLNEVKKTDYFSGIDAQWVHRLEDLEGLQTDAVMFAGSERSVPGVIQELDRLGLKRDNTRILIRTAHFSIAYLDNQEPEMMKALVEAIFRYGGMGCRSVAIVVSPFSLDSIKCELTDYIEAFWLDNPQHRKPGPKLKHRFAYNKGIERPQAWLDHFLIQEGGLELDQDFICYWEQGDEQTAAELANRFGERVQSVYVTHPDVDIPGYEHRTELLMDAQRPPISWKPDGVDVLEWLLKSDING